MTQRITGTLGTLIVGIANVFMMSAADYSPLK